MGRQRSTAGTGTGSAGFCALPAALVPATGAAHAGRQAYASGSGTPAGNSQRGFVAGECPVSKCEPAGQCGIAVDRRRRQRQRRPGRELRARPLGQHGGRRPNGGLSQALPAQLACTLAAAGAGQAPEVGGLHSRLGRRRRLTVAPTRNCGPSRPPRLPLTLALRKRHACRFSKGCGWNLLAAGGRREKAVAWFKQQPGPRAPAQRTARPARLRCAPWLLAPAHLQPWGKPQKFQALQLASARHARQHASGDATPSSRPATSPPMSAWSATMQPSQAGPAAAEPAWAWPAASSCSGGSTTRASPSIRCIMGCRQGRGRGAGGRGRRRARGGVHGGAERRESASPAPRGSAAAACAGGRVARGTAAACSAGQGQPCAPACLPA